jgi:light-regulated signal transduction histidine kinase (bacteriophytochrome)
MSVRKILFFSILLGVILSLVIGACASYLFYKWIILTVPVPISELADDSIITLHISAIKSAYYYAGIFVAILCMIFLFSFGILFFMFGFKPLFKRFNYQINELGLQLNSTKDQIGLFSQSASHGLRSPLNIIDGYSQILLEDFIDQLTLDGKENIEKIRQSVETMSRHLNKINDLSAISREEIIKDKINISNLVLQIRDELKHVYKNQNITMNVEPDIIMNGDRRMLYTALKNLLDNAVKFSSKSEESIIEVKSFKRDNVSCLVVKDNGVGFNMKYYDNLFLPFKRLHSEKNFQGIGMGLAEVKQIIVRHNGMIWAETGKEGSKFNISLP